VNQVLKHKSVKVYIRR